MYVDELVCRGQHVAEQLIKADTNTDHITSKGVFAHVDVSRPHGFLPPADPLGSMALWSTFLGSRVGAEWLLIGLIDDSRKCKPGYGT